MNESDGQEPRHAIVTGGSHGIGFQVARILAGQGFQLSLLARRADDLVTACEALSRESGAPTGFEACDVGDPAALSAALKRVTERRGPCHTLVTAAGMVIPGKFDALPQDAFRQQMEVNFFGTLHAVQAVYPAMAECGAGRIGMIASAAALIGVYGYTAYAASKFAVRGFAESLRGEAASRGIAVSVAYPGDTDTAQLEAERAHRPAATSAIAAGASVATPEAVARAVVRGMDRGTFAIYPNTATTALGWTASMISPVLNARFDRAARRAEAADD
ncbi:SDR family oxidoreductase [Acuticoccus sp. MNP-M23]|uniref:SDR family oxidoreductase n=1 Tax=Acuticoccus sp. MNP-M23 TaxID=3072793 RepID=UPI0028149F44|nr:SDR family oxidoreductase [Acuticoccus sp. MNP-M23]WMS44100.1 SDR family oxidoreductase [Acuticoccus sp. MNP-M23]